MIRFKGSTLLINGMVTEGSDEWAVYGGTGAFAMATGVIRRKNLFAGGGDSGGNSDELSVEVFCPVFGSPQQPPKVRTYVRRILSMEEFCGKNSGTVLYSWIHMRACRTTRMAPPSPRLDYGVGREDRHRTSRRQRHQGV